MGKNVLKHTHKLIRHVYRNGTPVYFCTLDCDYKISVPLSLGKKVICWRCGKEFSLNQYGITLKKPHCEDCHVHKGELVSRKQARRINDPAPVIAASIADSVVDGLKDKLGSITSNTEYRTLVVDENEGDDML